MSNFFRAHRLLFVWMLVWLAPSLAWRGNAADAQQPAPRVMLQVRTAAALPAAQDAGPIPTSQRVALTLTLASSATQKAALDQFLTDVVTPSSPSFHQWLTPQQFAVAYGATGDQLTAAMAWAASQGLSVDAISPSGTRLSVSGFTPQVNAVFGTSLDSFQLNGLSYFAAVTQPSLPASVSALFAAVDGLGNLPTSAAPSAKVSFEASASSVDIVSLAAIVDANVTPILAIDATSAASSSAQTASLGLLFRQAAAQGITSVVYGSVTGDGFPEGFPDVIAIAVSGSAADTAAPFAARPTWQVAAGLPADGMRYAPDLTASSLDAFTQTISSIALQFGGRLGDVNAVLYELAPTPGLYTQADAAAAGTWEPASGLGAIDLPMLAKIFPHGTGSSGVQVQPSIGSPTHGQGFTLTATVSSNNGGTTPTGTVTFTATQSGFPANSVALNGSATATTASLLIPGGNYNVTASYSGDNNYAAQTSSVSFTVQPEAAGFTISAPTTVTLGSTITATVKLTSTSGFGTPNVSVMVTPSGITGAASITQTIAGSGGSASANYTFTAIQAGNVGLQASCTSNDASFTCYTPQSATITVPQATPTIGLSISPAAPVAGSPVTLTAPVSGITGVGVTGSVQFFDGGSSLGFGAAPNATFTGTLAPGASHSLTAVYQGDANYLKATSSPVSTAVGTAPTSTVVNASATTAAYGQSVTLNITVAGTNTVNGMMPTGTLTFTGAGTVTSATISNGTANVVLSSLAVGTYTIGTSYSGDTNYAPSKGNTVVVTVTQSTASLMVQLSSSSFTTASTATVTVTVTLPGNSQLPTGSGFVATLVTAAGVSGTAFPGTFTANPGGNTGTGSAIIAAPPAGSYNLVITCATNTNFTCTPQMIPVTSTATTTVTTPTGTTVTTTALAISPTAPLVGQTITFTATVTAAATATATTPIAGTVSFLDGTTLITTATIGTGGVATATGMLAGSVTAHSLTAMYSGNAVYAASTSAAVPITIAAIPASVALTSSVSSGLAGSSVVLTATVAGSTVTGVAPSGTVTFYIVGATPTAIGTAVVSTTGAGISQAVLSTANLPAGALKIDAVYNGDTNFTMTTSNVITLGVSDYTLNFLPQTLLIAAGTSGTASIVVTPINGFLGQVVLSCTPPANADITCSFAPSVLSSGGGLSTLTINTVAAKHASLVPLKPHRDEAGTLGVISLAAVLCWLLPGRRRRRLTGLLLVLLVVGLSVNLGCSSNDFTSTTQVSSPGTPLGTTLLTINTAGTDGNNTVRHNATFQITVQ